MNTDALVSISSKMYLCSSIAGKLHAGSNEVFDLLVKMGGQLYFVSPGNPLTDRDIALDEDGDIDPLPGVLHPLLKPGCRVKPKPKFGGNAGFYYISSSQSVHFTQESGFDNEREVNELLEAHRAFFSRAIQVFRPGYAWIDETGENTPGARSIKKLELKYLFWANFFGPDYVQKYGRSFFLSVPDCRIEDFGELGILIVMNDSFTSWRRNSTPLQLAYLMKTIPSIQKFKSKGVR